MIERMLERRLTPKDVGDALGVHPKTARRLPGFPWRNVAIGKRPMPRCSREDFEQWWESRRRVA